MLKPCSVNIEETQNRLVFKVSLETSNPWPKTFVCCHRWRLKAKDRAAVSQSSAVSQQ